VRALDPEVVVIATGGQPDLEPYLGNGGGPASIASTHDILSGRVRPATSVLLYDAHGAYAGATCADFMANAESLVELVTPDPGFGEDLGGTVRPVYYRRLFEKDVIFTPSFALGEVYREDEKLVAVLRNEYTAQEEERVVDQVVVENGVRPDESLYYALKALSRNAGQVDLHALAANRPQPACGRDGEFLLYRVGDCVAARDIHAAIYDSLRLCKDF
jgi:pyruvate/2-oxoglutarate dehydrogenase complex dihydrolipoamide dehydrogenase (E3) component